MDNKEIVQMVLDFIQKTGTAMVQAGFAMSVRYVIANAIIQLATGLASWGFVGFSVYKLYRIFQDMDNSKSLKVKEGDNASGFRTIIYVLFGIIALVSASFNSPFEAAKMLIAPEWYAILNIINIVK
jgi:hypothetical protein